MVYTYLVRSCGLKGRLVIVREQDVLDEVKSMLPELIAREYITITAIEMTAVEELRNDLEKVDKWME